MNDSMTRRVALKALAAVAGGTVLSACSLDSGETTPREISLPSGILEARPGVPTGEAIPGLQSLPSNNEFSFGQYFVPASYKPDVAIPLVVLFHDTDARLQQLMAPMQILAEERGFALMAVNSRESLWDIVRYGYFGVDRNFINRSLPEVFNRVRIDPNRVGFAGFGGGASMALSLGLVNGDLVKRIVAFTPTVLRGGYLYTGKPSVYITHGLQDTIVPIANSRNNVSRPLENEGYTVDFIEFAGGYEIPPAVMREAAIWLTK